MRGGFMNTDGKKVVLLVDDEPDILELMEEEFQFNGYETMTALCGNDALSLLDVGAKTVDAIVSDYQMPNGNGLELLDKVTKIYTDEKSRPIFFFVSGQADISADQALDIGAKKFFPKPFDLDELIQEVSEEIEKAR
jgi:CheY-like chemotaxis protein